MTGVLGLRNDALAYVSRCDLQPSGPGARGSGRGAGPQARGALAALPPRPPAAGPQPWARCRRAARGRRASCGQRVSLASALGGEEGLHLQRAELGRGPGRAPLPTLIINQENAHRLVNKKSDEASSQLRSFFSEDYNLCQVDKN